MPQAARPTDPRPDLQIARRFTQRGQQRFLRPHHRVVRVGQCQHPRALGAQKRRAPRQTTLLLRVLPARVEVRARQAETFSFARHQPRPVDQRAHARAVQRRGEGDDGAKTASPGISVARDRERRAVQAHDTAHRIADDTDARLGRQRLPVEVQATCHRLGHVDQRSACIRWNVDARSPRPVHLQAGERAFEDVASPGH